jgi:hypothetical protein
MTTTAIFAEILVVGLQAMVWLALLCLFVADLNGFQVRGIAARLNGAKEWAPLITIFVLGFAYTCGIIVDRLADSIQSSIEKKFSTKTKPDESIPEKRLRVMKKAPEITKLLEYIRSRRRIARSTSLNLLLTTVAAALLARHLGGLWILTIVGTGLALVIVSIFVSRRIARTYDERLSQADELV